jgi:uncharacterized protein
LSCAAYGGFSEIAKSLITAGASLDHQENDFEWTPLMRAAYRGRTEIAESLIEAGASLDKLDSMKRPALMVAA